MTTTGDLTQPRRVRYGGLVYEVRAEADGWLWLKDAVNEPGESAGMLIRHEIVEEVTSPLKFCSFCDKPIIDLNRHIEGRGVEYVHVETCSKRCYPQAVPNRPQEAEPGPTEPESKNPSVDDMIEFVEEWGTKGLQLIKTIRAMHGIQKGKYHNG